MAFTTSYTLATLRQMHPSFATHDGDVAGLDTGGFVVVGDHTGHVDTAVYDANGNFVTENYNITDSNPSVTKLNNGNYVVATQDANSIVYSIYSPTGVIIKSLTDIGDADANNPQVVALQNGGFAIFNHDSTGGTNFLDINVFDAAGTSQLGGAFNLTDGGFDPAATVLDNGTIAITYSKVVSGQTQLWMTLISADGSTFISNPHMIDNFGENGHVSLAAVNNGFVMVYEDTGWGSGPDITFARYDNSGALVFWSDLSDAYNPADGSADALPQVTRVSGDLVAVSWDQNVFADTDTDVALVDSTTGAVLASHFGLVDDSVGDDVQNTSIAGYAGGNLILAGDDVTDGVMNLEIIAARRVLTGGAAADTIKVTLTDMAHELYGLGGGDKLTGGALRDALFGGDGADSLFGGAGNDFLYGGAGADKLDGGTGADLMDGGAGGDTYTVDDSGDVIVELAGGGTDLVKASVDYTLSANVENLTLTGSATTGVGNSMNNVINGNGGVNSLYGDVGNDTLVGGGGDFLYGGVGNDTYTVLAGDTVTELGGGGTDTVKTALNNYTLTANVEKLTLTGVADLDGNGNVLANTLTGNTGNNVLKGFDGIDTIVGGAGNDWLYGGAGADKLTGGAGNDRFVFDNFGGVDSVADFATGADRIVLDKTVFTAFSGLGSGAHITSGDFTLGAAATNANQNIIYDTTNGHLYYDADGNGAGAQVQIATLTGHPALAYTDVYIL